ncbi:putative protein, unknown function [Reticulomyxa filosa]|uniref:Kelch motif family protein n=1 Tax=Reticulomyxa filosa TaxID=46433 RepID=X6MPF7_RETFI|nr:putative protein, unknown function [Reticulomyxa filosa]|eukprot:ETO15322.1 putative protein, unknown function [Reticulomyxa filosa]
MTKQTTIQNSPERETEPSQQRTTHFQTLKELPTPLADSQCVLHKHELFICGDKYERACYSYHTLKNEYKLICEYSSNVTLCGHCVVKLEDSNSNNDKDNNQITLFVWNDDNNNGENQNETNKSKKLNELHQLNKSNNYNQWVPFTDNHNHPIIIGRDHDDYEGARALLVEINNNFVFNLNTFQYIKHDKLPTNNDIWFHCFISKSENGQVQEMMKTNQKYKQNYQMLLFCKETGLSIEYDEDTKTFQFQELPVCDDIAPFYEYAYVCINDVILLFDGCNWSRNVVSKSVHKYSIRENKWMTFQNTLSSPLYDCVAILSEDNTYVHIIGGFDGKQRMLTHMKIDVSEWLSEEEMKKGIELKVEEDEKKNEDEEEKDSDSEMNKIVKKKGCKS